ncbi:MAG: tandem-95 repeat protein [Candidatus Cloacimonetes bacterium]|nr:tandem-95 repeat protein [Candidatus Cloacimonadota bacterium]
MRRQIFMILLLTLAVSVLQADLADAGFVMSDVDQLGLSPFDFVISSSELTLLDPAISFQFILNYDAGLFAYNGYAAGDALPGMVVVNDLTPGVVNVAYAGAEVLEGTLELLTVNLTPLEPCETQMSLSEARYNNTDIYNIVGGSVVITGIPEVGFVIEPTLHQGMTPLDVTVTSTDILLEDGIISYQFSFHYDSALLSYVDYSYDESLGGILVLNPNAPGLINVAYSGADAITGINELLIVTLQPLEFGYSEVYLTETVMNIYPLEDEVSSTVTVYPDWEDFTITVTGADVFTGDQFESDILTSLIMPENGIISFQFILNYDAELMEYAGIADNRWRLDDFIINATVPGVIQAAYASAEPIYGEGLIVGFLFNAISDGTDQIELSEFVYNNEYITNLIPGDVTITNPNNPPIADAGEDFALLEGAEGMLDGSGSYDPNDDTITYFWQGDIELSDPASVNPTFTAPEVEMNTDYTFTLTVNDGEFDSIDEVIVTVINVPNPADAVITVESQETALGEEFAAGIYTTPLSADFGVISYQYLLTYDPAVITYTGFSEGEGMPEGILVVNGNEAGVIQVAFSSADPITAPMALNYLNFTADVIGETDLVISDFYYNNIPVVNLEAGSVIVRVPYYYVGVYAEDVDADLEMEFTCNIMTEELQADWNIISYQFHLYYDPAMLSYEGYGLGDVPQGGSLLAYQVEPGHLSVAFADYNALSGAGSLAGFNFIPLQLGSTEIMLDQFKYNAVYLPNVGNGIINIGIPYADAVITAPELVVGGGETFTVAINTSYINAAWNVISFQFNLGFDADMLEYVGYSNGSIINSGNLLAYENATGNVSIAFADFMPISGEGSLIELEFTAALELGQSVLNISDFKYNSLYLEYLEDGLVTIIEPYTDAVITCADAETREGLNFFVGISTTEIQDNWGVISFQFNVGYDTQYVDYVGYEAGDMITSGNLLAFENADGNIAVAFADYMSLSGVGDLIVLEFTALLQGETVLDLNQFKYNSLYLENLVDGNVYIEIGDYPPIADAGADQVVYEGDLVQLDGTASYDPDDFLRNRNAPDWSVNPPDFEYSCSFWGTISYNGVYTDDINDIVAVFVGDECRGIASLEYESVVDYTVQFGYILFGPMVYSDLTGGETLSFKVYDTSRDIVYDLDQTYPFIADNAVGGPMDPYIFDVTVEPGGDLDYLWTAPAEIVLDDPTSPLPTFTAPWVTENTDFVIELLVYDGAVWSEADAVTITVLDNPVSNLVVSAPVLETEEDMAIDVPITTTMLQPDMTIISYQFNLFYDPAVLQFDGYTAGAISTNMLVVNEVEPGNLSVAYADFTPIVGAGELLTFQFMALEGGVSPLDIENFKYNNVYITTVDGQVTVEGYNDTPIFDLPDTFYFDEDTELTVDFSQFIIDPDNDMHTIIPLGATNLSFVVNGYDVTMSAPENWNGSEMITFIVNDESGRAAAIDMAIITVLPVNDPPVIDVPPVMVFDEDGEMIFDIGMYASDVDGDELVLTVTGSNMLNADIVGLVATITGYENWNGEETLTFIVDDQQSRATAQDDCNFIVLPINDPPVIDVPPIMYFDEDTEMIFDIGMYASDVDGDELILTVTGMYILTVNIEDLVATITAPENWSGNEVLTFIVDDQVSRVVAEDVCEFVVEPVNDAPTLNLPDYVSFNEDEFLNFDVAPWADDVEMNVLDIVSVEYTETGLINVFSGMMIDFSTELNWYGVTEVTVTITDNVTRDMVSDVMTIEVLPVNDAPTLDLPDYASFNEDEFLNFDVAPWADDVDFNALDIVSVEYAASGLINVFSGMMIDFSTELNWYGVTEITVTITDNVTRDMVSDVMTIEVLPVNDAPTLDLPDYVSFNEDEFLNFDVALWADDVDLDVLDIVSVEYTTSGLMNVFSGMMIDFSAELNWYGVTEVTVTITDNVTRDMISDMMIIEVLPVNDVPTLDLPDYVSFHEDEFLNFDVAPWADDVDFDVLDIVSVEYDQEFLYNVVTGMGIDFSAAANWFGVTEVTITVTDNVSRLVATDVMTVEVLPVNDDPVIILPDEFIFDEDGELVIDFTPYLSDIDADELLLTVEEGVNVFAVIEGFIVTFTVAEDWYGSEVITFYISDQQGRAIASDDIIIFVEPVNDSPVIAGYLPVENVITLNDTTMVDFSIDYSDIEGGCLISWYINDQLLPGISGTSLPVTFDENGNFTVKVELADGEFSFENIWTINVWMGPDWVPVVYPSSTIAYGRVSIDGLPASPLDMVGAFVGDEMRGWINPVINNTDGLSYVTINVQGVQVEEINFILYDYSANDYYTLYETFTTNPGNSIGTPPNFLDLSFGSGEGPNWSPVIYTNSTIVYCIVTIEGSPAASGDRIGAFVGPQCRAVADVVVVNRETAYATLVIQGTVPEIVHFKIWDSSEDIIYNAATTLETSPGNEIGYPPNEILINGTTSSNITQSISLAQGWNLMSINVYPESYLVADLFADLIDAGTLLKVKNIFNSYDPNLPAVYNTLNEFEDGSGYYVKVSSGTTFEVEGTAVNVLDAEISLNAGWNLKGYLPQYAQPLEDALITIWDTLLKVKDSYGSFDPALPPQFNTLTTMNPGSGYWIKMFSAATLIYPQGTGRYVDNRVVCTIWEPVIYPNSTITYGRAYLNNVPVEGFIAAFVGDECRAATAVDNGYVSLVINGQESETASFKLYQDGVIYVTNLVITTSPGEDISGLQLYFETGNVPATTHLLGAYPNPFNPETTVHYALAQDGKVNIEVYNLKGQLVEVLVNTIQTAGEYQLVWNASHETSGIYFLRFSTNGVSETQKVILMK